MSQYVKMVQGCDFPVELPFTRLGHGDVKQMWVLGLQNPIEEGMEPLWEILSPSFV